MKIHLLLLFMLVSLSGMGQLNGNYTINSAQVTGGANYQTFAEALAALNGGISGPVRFDVVGGSGPYNEQVILTSVPGVSSTNTITIDGHGNMLTYASVNTAERATIKLNNSRYVTIHNLVIQATGTYGYGVQLINNSDNNIISNCIVSVDPALISTSGGNFAGILINSAASPSIITSSTGASLCDSNIITGNLISGGNAGIAIVANGANSMVYHNKIINNTIRDFYSGGGVYLNGGNGTVIEGNDISRPTRVVVGIFYGIQMNGVSYGTVVSKNKIHTPFGGLPVTSGTYTVYGISVAGVVALPDNGNVFSNNLVRNIKGTGIQNGFYIGGAPYSKFYHNTVNLDDATTTTNDTYGFHITNNTLNTQVTIQNNIVTLARSGSSGTQRILYFAIPYANFNSPMYSFFLNNNDYYFNASGGTGSKYVAQVGGTSTPTSYSNLEDWQEASGQDMDSRDLDPGYVNPAMGDLTPSNNAINDIGMAGTGITTDITGMMRSPTPDPGAFEFTPGAVLPLHFNAVSITGADGCAVDLRWDFRNTGLASPVFVIERSDNGITYNAIHRSALEAFYYRDIVPSAGNWFYRIGARNDDGEIIYSRTLTVRKKSCSGNNIDVYPNPVKDVLHILFRSNVSQHLSYAMYDLQGRMVQQGYITSNRENVLDVDDLVKGSYLLILTCNGYIYKSMFIYHQ